MSSGGRSEVIFEVVRQLVEMEEVRLDEERAATGNLEGKSCGLAKRFGEMKRRRSEWERQEKEAKVRQGGKKNEIDEGLHTTTDILHRPLHHLLAKHETVQASVTIV